MLKGVLLSVFASALFGGLYFYTTQLDPLSGEEIYGWRMLLTLPAMSFFCSALAIGAWCVRLRAA